MRTSWKQRNLDYLELIYGKCYQTFKVGDYHDDRRIFINSYDMIQKGLESLQEEPEIFVKCAVNNALENEFNRLDVILDEFELGGLK